jgi:hypothetical protein
MVLISRSRITFLGSSARIRAAAWSGLPNTALKVVIEPADDDVEGAWVAEIEKRARAVEDGTAELEDWHEVRDRIRARYQKVLYWLVYLDSEVLVIAAAMHQRRRADVWVYRLSGRE